MFGANTVFLQQAAHLTGGSYIYLERRDALLQYLVVCIYFFLVCLPTNLNARFGKKTKQKMTFLPSTVIRKIISVPTEDKVDFRAACFCHKNIVDVGFVCSVCLSSMSRVCFQLTTFFFFFIYFVFTINFCPVFCQPIPVCSTCR
jgi:transcription initiation factor TFIIH subunit 3